MVVDGFRLDFLIDHFVSIYFMIFGFLPGKNLFVGLLQCVAMFAKKNRSICFWHPGSFQTKFHPWSTVTLGELGKFIFIHCIIGNVHC